MSSLQSESTASAGMSRAAKKRRKKNVTASTDSLAIQATMKQRDLKDKKRKKNLIAYIESKDFVFQSITEILGWSDGRDCTYDSKSAALLSSIIHPTTIDAFYASSWESTILHCSRVDDSYFSGIFSRKGFEAIIANHVNIYGIDIDISSDNQAAPRSPKENPAEISHPPGFKEGSEAKSRDVWNRFQKKSSIRLKCPQKINDKLWRILAALEHEFQAATGCYAILMAPESEGFGIEAYSGDSFMLQLEGSSKWGIIGKDPENSADVLLEMGPGDSLYIPKRWHFQNQNTNDSHSLYLQIITNENNSLSEILQLIVPQALQLSCEEPDPMKALPRSCLSFMGVASSENDEDDRRDHFSTRVSSVLKDMSKKAVDMLDAAADQVAKNFIGSRLPIPLTRAEEARSAAGMPDAQVMPYTRLRMLRPGIARVIVEDGMVVLYHCMDNARVLHGSPLQPLEFELDDGPTIEALLAAYPDGIEVSELPHASDELDDKLGVAQALFKEGFLLIEDDVSAGRSSSGKKKAKVAAGASSSSHDRDEEEDEEDQYEDDEDEDDDDPF